MLAVSGNHKTKPAPTRLRQYIRPFIYLLLVCLTMLPVSQEYKGSRNTTKWQFSLFFTRHPVYFQTGIFIWCRSGTPGLSISRYWVTNVNSGCLLWKIHPTCSYSRVWMALTCAWKICELVRSRKISIPLLLLSLQFRRLKLLSLFFWYVFILFYIHEIQSLSILMG